MHAHASSDPAAFERFVRGQLVWDRAMAEAIAAAHAREPRALIVGLLGRGHIEHGHGVPYQLAALGLADVATALPWQTDEPYSAGVADFVFGMPP